MNKTYNNFHEIERDALDVCDETVLFSNYEEEDLKGSYILEIFHTHIQELIIGDILANGYDEDLIDRIGDVDVSLPDELIDFYRDAVNLDDFDIPAEKRTIPVKMNKHQVYNMIADNQHWFEDQDRYFSCAEIEKLLNQHLKEKAKEKNRPVISINLSASTLSAMVRDGVMDRKFNEQKRCYWYRLALPLKEEYKSN